MSIGSLYQYFPGKEALVAAVIERHNAQIAVTVRRELADLATCPLAQGVRRLIAMAVKAHALDPKLHRVLAEQIPRVGRLENVEAFNSRNYALFREYLESRRDEIGTANLELASFICVTTIEALTHNAVLHGSKLFPADAMKALVDEGTRLIVAYLRN